MSWLQYQDTPFLLHSGDRSHWLIDSDQIFNDEELRESVLLSWQAEIPISGSYEIVAIPRGGVPWAMAFAERCRPSTVFVLDHPEMGALLAASKEHKDLIVIDDVVTTGASLNLVPRAHHRLVVVDRSLSGIANTIAWARIPLPLVMENR
jgi:orotate phosphoribosyltransferase